MRITHYILCFAALSAVVPAFASDCPGAPPGMTDIKAQGYYTDAAHSVIDETARREEMAMTRPLDDFTKQVADMSDRYLADHDVAAGQCVLQWIDAWAHDRAMLGQMVHINNDQSDYLREWVHAGTAIAYLKVRALATDEQRAQIDPWLKQLSVDNLAYWDNPRKKRNNHYYWTGVGIMATGVATNDDKLLDVARGIYEKGIGDIQSDGSLPMEMDRGKRALHYHNYALAPLVMIAEMARLKGQDWYAYDGHRINLLAERVASGARDSTWFAQQAGTRQEKWQADGDVGWVDFYRLRAPHPQLFEALHNDGPYDNPRLGGNLTLMASVGIEPSK
jgi:poly(beta-D-mannuronate) lyase